MATKTTITRELVDDMDGRTKTGVRTVSFALNGIDYEIDLGPRYQQSLAHVLESFTRNARLAGTKAKAPVRRDGDEAVAIRAWAGKNGYTVAPRGRIPNRIVDAYRSAA